MPTPRPENETRMHNTPVIVQDKKGNDNVGIYNIIIHTQSHTKKKKMNWDQLDGES